MVPLLALAALTSVPPADLTAVGLVLAHRREASLAILRAGGRSRVVGLGETAFGGRITDIGEGTVVIEFGSTRTELRLAAGNVPPPPAPAAVVASAGARGDGAGEALVLDRREMERRLAVETTRILAETSLVPVQQGSQLTGFAIGRMPEGTVLSEAGLRAGDVLTEVNGVPVDSLATLIGLWPKLQNESLLRAVVLREGRPVTLTVSLR